MEFEPTQLLELAHQVQKMALAQADVAEVSLSKSWELSAKVRLSAPELLEEAGQSGVSLRVLRKGKLAMSSTSDLSPAGLQLLVKDALELADLAESDPLLGPAEASELAQPPFPELDLYDAEVSKIDAAAAIELARRAEQAAFAFDPRVEKSDGARCSRLSVARVLLLSSGFEGYSQGSLLSLSATPVVVDQGGKNRRGSYHTGRRHASDLLSPEAVGQKAAERCLLKLGAKQVKTGEAQVIFDPDAARSIISTWAGCLVGGALYRRSSYLLDRLETEVASPQVQLVDDPLIVRGPGSRPFDGEGLASTRRVLVEKGRLKSYLLDCYAARKLGLKSTASALRAGGGISASHSNLYLEPGELSLEQIIAQTARGLLVTDMMGFGFNALTGDFSRGASGFWIEDGKIQHPVSEVTISGNLDTMLKGIDLLGEEQEFDYSVTSPSFRVEKMMISGS